MILSVFLIINFSSTGELRLADMGALASSAPTGTTPVRSSSRSGQPDLFSSSLCIPGRPRGSACCSYQSKYFKHLENLSVNHQSLLDQKIFKLLTVVISLVSGISL